MSMLPATDVPIALLYARPDRTADPISLPNKSRYTPEQFDLVPP